MARYRRATCKLARREGADLSLKSPARALDSKCKLENKPGQHGANKRMRMSDYAVQLREKQKVKRIYVCLSVAQQLLHQGVDVKGNTGEPAAFAREPSGQRRLSHGFCGDRAQARQLVAHKAILQRQEVNILPTRLARATRL